MAASSSRSSTPFDRQFSSGASRLKWPLLASGALTVLLTTGLGTAYGVYASWRGSGLLAQGLSIAGEPVGGLSPMDARRRLEKKFANTGLIVRTPERDIPLSLRKLGGKLEIERVVRQATWYGRSRGGAQDALRFWSAQHNQRALSLPVTWDKNTMRQTMRRVSEKYRVPAQDARLKMGAAGLEVVPGQPGRALNAGATLVALQKAYYPGLQTVRGSVQSVAPQVQAADLQGRDVKMGTYTTRFNPGLVGRTKNIHIAVSTFDGRVLMPGEEFSFNQSTGERTWDKGYRTAHIFVTQPGADKAEVVEGLAGGVCQVSTTLYNAVRKTNEKLDNNIQIVERNSHSLPVTYVSPGYDATVAWPYKDFKFRNTLSHPIYLRSKIEGSHLTIDVWGRVKI